MTRQNSSFSNIIEVSDLTKDYGFGRGVFDVNLHINRGEVFVFLGPNGAGKSTTIRHLMGFLKPKSGTVTVNGLSSWEHSSEIVRSIGYVPGEIAFPDLKTGVDFLKCQADFLGLKNMSYANRLIERLQLDPSANLKRMSKGMKKKTALVAALMNDAPIIILDEPTTGLDPLMRATFLDIIKEEHNRGKTIFMSSHSFDELEKNCDRAALISDGKIVDICSLDDLRNISVKDFKIEFKSEDDYRRFLKENYEIIRLQDKYNQATIRINSNKTAELLTVLKNLILLNVGAFLVLFALSGLCFFTSCVFDRSKRSMAIGGGLSIFALVAAMLGLFGSPVIPSVIRLDSLNYFNKATVISLFDVISIIDGTNAFIGKLAILAVLGIIGYIAGSARFTKKDLPL